MENRNKPRHIRDIAHLYLSRLPEKHSANRARLYLVASSVDCFSAFHTANVALCFRQRGFSVRVLELSGVLPCCGYFLKLPPRVYIKRKKESPAEELSALAGISLCFAVQAPASSSRMSGAGVQTGFRRRSGSGIDIVHLPPFTAPQDAQRALQAAADARDSTGGPVRALVLAPDDETALTTGGRLFGTTPDVDWVTLALDRNQLTDGRAGNFRQSLGYLAGWRPLLSDPLPCVVRDPDSHVARSYFSVSEALIPSGRRAGYNHDVARSKRPESAGRFR